MTEVAVHRGAPIATDALLSPGMTESLDLTDRRGGRLAEAGSAPAGLPIESSSGPAVVMRFAVRHQVRDRMILTGTLAAAGRRAILDMRPCDNCEFERLPGIFMQSG